MKTIFQSIRKTTLLLCIFFCSFTYGQEIRSVHEPKSAPYTIEPSAQWTQLFKRQTGWTGGDGIYSIQLPQDFDSTNKSNKKDNILFLFSDSVIDTLINGRPSPSGWTMIHNAVAVLNGVKPDADALRFYWPQTDAGKPASVFIPAEEQTLPGKPKDDSIYYWLGDGIALTGHTQQETPSKAALAIFAYKMINTSSEPFGFKEIGNELLLTNDRFKIIHRVQLPPLAEGTFGAGIYRTEAFKTSHENTPYIYVYGVRGPHKGLVVARTTEKELANPDNWQYYTGKAWSKDLHQCTDITAHVSNELSVTRIPDGRYALIFQLDGIQPYIGMRIGPTPFGPFGPMDTLWHCTEPTAANKLLVYNAKAHPSLSPSGTLLISYNVNSLTFLKTLNKEPTFYRPRFLLLRWK